MVGITSDWLHPVLTTLACISFAALFASMESALFGVPEARVRAAIERDANQARHLLFWLENEGRVLTTLQLLQVAGLIASGISARWLIRAMEVDDFALLASIVLIVAGVLVTQIVPRSLGKRYAKRWTFQIARVARVVTILASPLVAPLMAIGRWLSARDQEHENSPYWTPSELSQMASDAHDVVLGKGGKDLLHSIIEFSDTIIREIMVPRADMVTIPVTSTPEEVKATLREAGHSRIPVYEDTVDNIVGLLHVKELVAAGLLDSKPTAGSFDLRRMLRSCFYVPEVMKISELLREFQRRKTHLAIVVDEFGGTAGVVTLEDIIEVIFGEIHDEYDVDEKQFRVLTDNKIIADARVSVWDLETALGVEFPEDAAYETLAGFIMSKAGFLPQAGTVINWNNLRFTVKEANEKRIGTVEIERPGATPPAPPPPTTPPVSSN